MNMIAEVSSITPAETRRIKIWLDADIIHWFKSRAEGGKGYQTAINAALRKVVEEATGGLSFGDVAPVTVTPP